MLLKEQLRGDLQPKEGATRDVHVPWDSTSFLHAAAPTTLCLTQ